MFFLLVKISSMHLHIYTYIHRPEVSISFLSFQTRQIKYVFFLQSKRVGTSRTNDEKEEREDGGGQGDTGEWSVIKLYIARTVIGGVWAGSTGDRKEDSGYVFPSSRAHKQWTGS